MAKQRKISKTEQAYIDDHPTWERRSIGDVHRIREKYKAQHGGRGKYKRPLRQYWVRAVNHKKKSLGPERMVWGYKNLRDEKRAIRRENKGTWYKLVITKGVKK